MSHCLEVRRIHATANPAQMIDREPVLDRPIENLVREPMRQDLRAAEVELSVSAWELSSDPQPAARHRAWLHLRPEAIGQASVEKAETTRGAGARRARS
jgi:hypothetical protein